MTMALDQTSQMAALSDEALLVLYANGDPDAAQHLTQRLTPRLYAQAYRMLGQASEAEDVTQEALLRLWRTAPEWRQGEAQVTTWLYRVTANLCTDRLRRSRRMQPLEESEELLDLSASAAEHLLQLARHDALQAALLALPVRQRQAVVLRHLEELSNPEIAEIMGIGTEAVESLTARGKRGLKAILAHQKDALGYEGEAL